MVPLNRFLLRYCGFVKVAMLMSAVFNMAIVPFLNSNGRAQEIEPLKNELHVSCIKGNMNDDLTDFLKKSFKYSQLDIH